MYLTKVERLEAGTVGWGYGNGEGVENEKCIGQEFDLGCMQDKGRTMFGEIPNSMFKDWISNEARIGTDCPSQVYLGHQ